MIVVDYYKLCLIIMTLLLQINACFVILLIVHYVDLYIIVLHVIQDFI